MVNLDVYRLACELTDPMLRPAPPRRWYRLMRQPLQLGLAWEGVA